MLANSCCPSFKCRASASAYACWLAGLGCTTCTHSFQTRQQHFIVETGRQIWCRICSEPSSTACPDRCRVETKHPVSPCERQTPSMQHGGRSDSRQQSPSPRLVQAEALPVVSSAPQPASAPAQIRVVDSAARTAPPAAYCAPLLPAALHPALLTQPQAAACSTAQHSTVCITARCAVPGNCQTHAHQRKGSVERPSKSTQPQRTEVTADRDLRT